MAEVLLSIVITSVPSLKRVIGSEVTIVCTISNMSSCAIDGGHPPKLEYNPDSDPLGVALRCEGPAVSVV